MTKRLTTYLSIIILPTLLLATETSTSAVGQLVYFPFNGNANDASGSGYNGITTGSVTFPATGGISGGYANIAGTSDKISIPHNSSFNMPDSFTVHFWFRQRSNQSAAQTLVKKGSSTTYNFYVFRQLWNQYNFGPVIAGYRSNVTGYWKQVSNSNQLTHNAWHHVAYTKTSTGHAYYLDSKLISYSSTTDPAKTNSNDIIICDTAIDTDIDELKIYNRALSASEISSYYNSLDVTVPSSPTNLTATGQSGQIYLYWTASTDYDVVKYYIFRSTTSGFTPSASNKIDSSSTSSSYTDTNVTFGTTYYYKISAIDGAGHESGYSSQATGSSLIAAPTGLTATPGNTQVTLRWDKNTESIVSKYYIYGGIWSYPWEKVDSTLSISDTTKTITGLTNGTTYYYRIKAVDTSGNLSDYSSEVNAVPFDNVPPAIPTGLTASPGDSLITLKWNKNTETDFAKYIIYGGTSTNPTAKVDSTTNISDTTKTMTGLTSGTTYYYRITGVDTLGNESGFSSDVSEMPLSKEIFLTSSFHNFGNVQINTTSNWTYYVKNIGNDTLTVSNITKGLSTYSVNPTSGNINPGDSLSVTVSFTPIAITSYPDTLRVFSNDSEFGDTLKLVTLSGTGMDTLPPAAPQNLVLSAGDQQIAMTWNKNTETDFDKYIVYGGTSTNPTAKVDSTTSIGDTTKTITGLTNGTTYYYRITAVDTNRNESGYSSEVSASPSATNPTPSTPTNFTLTPKDDQLTLNWTPVGDSDLSKYRVYRGNSQWNINILDSVLVSSSPNTAYTDNAVDNDTLYYYYITAVDSAGQESSNSDTVHVMPTIVPDGLVALYNFSGNMIDGSGEENDGTNYGANQTYNRFNNWGKAYNFDGVSDYLLFNSFNNGLITNSLTIDLWINLDVVGGTIIEKRSGNNIDFDIEISSQNQLLYTHFGNLGNFYGTTVLSANTWYHITATYNNQSISLYVNGILDGQYQTSGNISTNSSSIFVGSYAGGSNYFDGVIDDIRIYDRALTTSEIQTLFEVGGWDPAPTTPQNFYATPGNDQLTLGWDPVRDNNLAKYRIYRGKTQWNLNLLDSVVAASSPDTFYVDNVVDNDTLYYYYVTAVDSAGQVSDQSDTVHVMPTIVPDGLVALYNFYGNVLDGSGEGNDGTKYGATQTYDRFGDWGKAYYFDGNTDYVTIPNSMNNLSDLTVETWFKYTNTNTWRWVFGTITGFVQVGASVAAGDDILRYHFSTSNGSFSDGDGSHHVNPNEWYQLSLTYDGTTVKGYIDGELDFERAWTGQVSITDQPAIGAGFNSEWFYGSIDEFRIYDRAITSTEIQTLYDAGGWDPSPGTPTNLTAAGSNESVTLSWNKIPDSDLAKYRIYRRWGSTSLILLDSVMAASPPDTFYTDHSVINDTTYYYQVTAVDSAGQGSGYSNEVSVTPTAKVTVELLVGATTTSTGSQDQGYALNTYYHDVKHQSLYHAADLDNAGLSPGATITAIDIYPAQTPGMDLSSFRIATAWTNEAALSDSFLTTSVVYGPTYHYTADFPTGAWVRFPITPILWNGLDNLVVEFSHDNTNYASGGGVYLRHTGSNSDRGRRGWSDSNAGNYPFTTNMGSAPDDKVAYLQLTYTVPKVLSPSNITAIPSYQQVDLSWTASISDSIANYKIYRGTTSINLTAIGTAASTASNYSDTGLVNGTTYYYGIRSIQIDGDSSAMTTPVSAVPSVETPSNLSIAAAPQQVTLSWDAPSGSGVAKTYIYQRDASTATFLADSTSDGTTVTKTITGLTNGTMYYFAIKYKGQDGTTSAYSDTVNATPDYTGPTFWVAENGSNTTGDGRLTSPFLTIQQAIDKAVSGDTIKIKPGSYSGVGNYDLNPQKDLFIMGVGGADSVTIDVGASADNRHSAFDLDLFPYSAMTIKGLKIVNALSQNGYGGAMILFNAGSVNIIDCVIGPGNKAAVGAGIFIENTSATIDGTVIKGNSAPMTSGNFSGDVNGVGVYISNGSTESVTIKNSVIRGNVGTANGPQNDMFGGGFYITGQNTNVYFINTIIFNNELTRTGVSNYWSRGGGGAIDNGANVYFVHSDLLKNNAENTDFPDESRGGALWINDNASAIYFLNSIIWGNTASSTINSGDQMFAGDNFFNITMHYSDAQEAFSGESNLSEDPHFTDDLNNIFSLDVRSGLLGAGASGSQSTYPGYNHILSTDFLGNVRPNPSGSNPDIGAIENSLGESPVPDAPTDLAATPGDGQVILTWTAHSETDVEKYGIYYGTTSGPTVKQKDVTGRTTVTDTITGLSNSQIYYFRMTAIDSSGYESAFSSEISVTPQFLGTTIYVDVDSAGAGYTPDGSDTKPYGSIQEAINASNVIDGVRVLVNPGTYTGLNNEPVVDLIGKQLILESVDGPATTIIDAGGASGNRSALRLDKEFGGSYNGYTNSTKFIGFTFQNGDNSKPLIVINGPDKSIDEWAPSFENCKFIDSRASSQDLLSVIWIFQAEPVFDGCEFRNLTVAPASADDMNIYAPIRIGGADNFNFGADTTIYRSQFLNCIIAENSSTITNSSNNNGKNFFGGALFIGYGAVPYFENTRIDSNSIDSNPYQSSSWANGGGVYIDSWFAQGPPIKFINCSISDNTVEGSYVYGGGIYSRYPRVDLINCLVTGNNAQSNFSDSRTYGGAIYFSSDLYQYGSGPAQYNGVDQGLRLINSTIADNEISPNTIYGDWGGAGICRDNPSDNPVIIFNSIITDNATGTYVDDARVNLSNNAGPFGSTNALIDYSIIEFFSETGLNETYLMDADPGFIGNGDYTLSTASLAIGAGIDQYEGVTAPAFDYNNDSRPKPSGSNPDLGAFENSLSTTPYPSKPQNLVMEAVGDSSVTLSWTANTEDDISQYMIYYGTATATTLLDSISGTPSYTATGLDNGITYYFAVAAKDLDGYESSKSNEVSGVPKWVGPLWYVDETQTSGSGKDGSPSLPFREIQDAIDAVDPLSRTDGLKDTVIVLPGTYDRSDDQNLVFVYNNGDSNDGQPKNIVLKSRDGAATTILDGEGSKRLFEIVDKTDTTLHIIGFTITGGGESDGWGNAVRVEGQSYWDYSLNQQITTTSGVIFKNCIIKENGTETNPEEAPVIRVSAGDVRFVDCVIENNHVSISSGSGEGGTIQGKDDSRITVIRTKILDNSLTAISADAYGAGIYIGWNDNNKLTAINSVIARNTATAGSSSPSRGAGITVRGGKATIINSTIVDNNNIDQYQFENGAGIYVTYGSGDSGTKFNLFNSIVSGNTPLQKQLQIDDWLDVNHFVSYSIIQGGDVDNYEDGVFEANPEFVDLTYVLSDRSPAIGAGETESENTNGDPIFAPTVDLAGNTRPVPSGSNPDMGAYEHNLAITPFPAPVQNLVATPLHQAVLLDWDFSPDQNVDRYVAYVSDDSITFTVDDTVSGRFTTRTTIGSLTNGENYWFYVTALDTGGFESSPSLQVKATPFFQGPVWVVDTDNGSVSGEGSLNDPLRYIRDAIETAVDGDTIMLMPGTYTGSKNRDLDFQYNNDIVQNGVKNLVLMSMYGPDTTVVELDGNSFLEVISGETFKSKLIGITIQNSESGAVNINNNSELKIKDCIFYNNSTDFRGGAVFVSGASSVKIRRTLFQENSSNNFSQGGALSIDNANCNVSNCIFYQNTAQAQGGAIYVDLSESKLQVIHSLFLENESGNGPAAIGNGSNPDIGIVNTIFWDNMENGSNSRDIDYASSVENCILQEGSPVMNLGDNYSFDPEIIGSDTGNFSLSEYSGAIGLGLESYYDYFSDEDRDVPTTDFLGNARPQPDSTLPDIGPIEHRNAEPRRSVYYVDNSGNDNNDGSSPANALRTIKESLNQSSFKDTIELAPGIYSGLGNRELSMNGVARIIRSAVGSASTIIDCENQGRAFVFDSSESDSVLIKGITIMNGSTPENGGGVFILNADPVFENVIFENNSAPNGSGGAVYASNSHTRFINCVFTANRAAESGAIAASGGDVTIDFTTAVGNRGNDLISFSGELNISNSIIWYNSPLDNSVSVAFSDVMGGNAGIGNYNGRPGFVDGLNGDFHLKDWSPVIGKANGSAGVLYDIEGFARSDSIPDMGAYENTLDSSGTYTKHYWYVSTTGSDSVTANMGTDIQPHKTIQYALNRAIFNDEIRILPGNYHELLNNWGKDITIVGHSGIPDDVTIDGYYKITGGSPGLYDLHLTNGIGNNDILQINNNATATLYNLLITHSNSSGISVNNTAAAALYNMTIYGNFIGIEDNSSGNVSVTNSIIWNNGSSILGSPTITYSAIQGSYTGSGNISDNPLFIDAALGNYRIGIQSPCIDAGNPESIYDSDSTVVDMGAFPRLRDFYSGTTSGNVEITSEESAVLTGDLIVTSSDTMNIDAGGTVYFEPGATLTVEGVLGISGTSMNPISFKSTDPDSSYGGVIINILSAGRAVNDVYSYMVIEGVGSDFIPLTINGNATIEHITIAGNENSTSLIVNDGTVALNYSILEGSASGTGTIINTGSFVNSTDQFANYNTGDFTLLSSAPAIDMDTTENWLDPDNTFADAGSYFHDQSGYTTGNIVVLYPLADDIIPVSPDTSSIMGGGVTVRAQVYNIIGHYQTNPTISWAAAAGTLDNNFTYDSDLWGRISNTFYTTTTLNDLNSVTVEDNGTIAQSGYFKVVAGAPDSVWIIEQSDTTVNQTEEREISGNVIDQFGNDVANGTPITWELIPSNVVDWVNIIRSDNVTQDGAASITLQVKSDITWSFDFVVQLTSNGISTQSNQYHFFEVTAPEAVLDIAINPNGWTSVNDFTISWTNPSENSGIAGAHYTIDGGSETYVAVPGIQSLENIALPNNAVSLIDVWLEDNLGNENSINAQSIEAKWDNTAPNDFTLMYPMNDWYSQSKFRFQWNASSDATAGLEHYDLVINTSDIYSIDPDSTAHQVPGEFSEGTYSWSVVAFDSAGNETTSSNPQTFNVDFTSPTISHNPVLEGTENTTVTITAAFSDNTSGIDIAELYYRKGGEVQWQGPVDMSTLNTYQIASSFVTSSGMEYYLYSRDAAGNEIYKPSQGYYSTSITITEPGLSSADRWPTGIPNGSAVTSYQLLSFPGQAANSTPTNILVDDLGEYDDTKWRLFEYSGSGAWSEFANISTLQPGAGYFLIVKDPALNINTGQTRTVTSDVDFPITLVSGDWIMFGNPYDFSIPLTNVYINDSTNLAGDDNLYTYDSNWLNPTEIEPWKGYIYKSAASANNIYIKPRKSNGGMAKQLDQEIVLMENEWLVDIKARNGLGVDELNTIGVLATAKDDYDEMDAFEPPMLPGGISLMMDHSNWAKNGDTYTKDIRSIKKDGEFWDMNVAAEDDKYNVYLYFEGQNDIPSDFDVFLIDVTLGVAQDLRWNPVYRYAVSNAKSIHNIRFIAGTKEFLSDNNAGIDLYPDRYSISQNYPNPFNPQTSILITLEDIATVDLIVYNILGEEVTRIIDNELRPAGYHNMIWKGLNRDGKRVASGVYFYTTRIKDVSGKMILNKTNKMIMVK